MSTTTPTTKGTTRSSPPAKDEGYRKGSLLEILGEAHRQVFLRDAKTRSYGVGERIVRRDDEHGAGRLDEVAVVLSGEVSLTTRDGRAAQVGVVGPGDAIELRHIFAGADDWHYNWVTSQLTTIASVSRTTLDALAKSDPVLHRYVEHVTCYPELERLGNDLRLFGMTNAHIRRVVGAFVSQEIVSRVDLRLDGPHIGVLRRGEVDVETRDQEAGDDPLARYSMGDYFVFAHDDDLNFQPTEATMWLLSRDAWTKLSGADPKAIERFMRFADPRLHEAAARKEAEPAAAEPGTKEQKKVQKDEGPEISAFVADADTLKRLHKKKKVYVQQHDEMDCGAACLSMVAQFHGRRITVPTFRSLVHVTRDGASLFSLKKAAEHVGFEAIGVKTEYHALAKYMTPFVCLTEYHFVVVYKATQTEITVADPARGLWTMPAQDFKAEWSGVALLCKPTPKLNEYPQSTSSYLKYLKVLTGLRKFMAEALLASVLVFALSLVPPLFMQFIFDKVLPAQKRELLDVAAAGVLIIIILKCLAEWARNYLLTYIASRADAKFAALFLARTFELPLSFFAVRRVGAITTRLAELTRVRTFMTDQTLALLINVMSAVIYAGILGFYNIMLLVVIVVTMPMSFLFVRLMQPKLKKLLQEVFKVQARFQSVAFEHFSAFETVKSINGMIAARWRWEMLFSKLLQLRRQGSRLVALSSSATSVFDGVTSVAVLLTSVWLYTRHQLSLGQVVATNALVSSVTQPISALIGQWETFTQIGVSFSRIDDVLTSAPEDSGEKTPTLTGKIEFEDVQFQYGSELSPWALRGVSFSINAGETVAFVGASGSGKTTLGYMVNLLYPPTRGRILLDGIDAEAISLASLRSQVAMITQDNSIFSGSILDTIALGDPHPSFERCLDAAKAADAHDFINRLKSNYSTELGEGGSGLSGGQRQRLNIARALYRNPSILIMDEATSALDALSERRVMEAIKKGEKKRTTIVIAHRLNTIMHVDRIFVFDKGRVVESGTHTELTEAQGHYYRLFKKQLSIG